MSIFNCNAEIMNLVISPTHKRAEVRAPVWGSEFTSKDAALHGGSSRNRCYAERKIVGSAWWLTCGILPPSRPILYLHGNLKPTRIGPFPGPLAGVALCFCSSRIAARCPAHGPSTQTRRRNVAAKN